MAFWLRELFEEGEEQRLRKLGRIRLGDSFFELRLAFHERIAHLFPGFPDPRIHPEA